MDNDVKKIMHQITVIAYQFACKYGFHVLSDNEWEQICADGDKAVKEFDDQPMPIKNFAHAMLIDVIYFYEDIAKEEKSNGLETDN